MSTKAMSNEELIDIVNASGWARVGYELEKEKEIEELKKDKCNKE